MYASNSVKVATDITSIEATTLNFQSNCPTLLPTFAALLLPGGIVHSLEYSGLQFTLILSKFADEQDLKLVKHVKIQINGLNSSKPYPTKIVQIPLVLNNKNIIVIFLRFVYRI